MTELTDFQAFSIFIAGLFFGFFFFLALVSGGGR